MVNLLGTRELAQNVHPSFDFGRPPRSTTGTAESQTAPRNMSRLPTRPTIYSCRSGSGCEHILDRTTRLKIFVCRSIVSRPALSAVGAASSQIIQLRSGYQLVPKEHIRFQLSLGPSSFEKAQNGEQVPTARTNRHIQARHLSLAEGLSWNRDGLRSIQVVGVNPPYFTERRSSYALV